MQKATTKKAPSKSTKEKCKECGKEFVDLKGHVATMHAGYELEITVNDVNYISHGETVRDALEGFIESNEFPFGAKTSAVFALRKDGKEAVTRLFPARARRLMLTLEHKSTALDVFAATLERGLVE